MGDTVVGEPLLTKDISPGLLKPSKRVSGLSANIWHAVAEWSQHSPIQPAVNLGLGLIKYNPPQFLIDAHKEALNELECNQYGPSAGLPIFKQTLADIYSHHFDRTLDPDKNICVTTGASEAILAALMAFVEHGDEVILIEPVFEGYNYLIEFVGGVVKNALLNAPQDVHSRAVSADEWKLDFGAMEALITPKTKMLILNTPHNPLGKIFTPQELHTLGTFCAAHSIILLSDEVYEHTCFNQTFSRPASLDSTIAAHTLSVGSIGKTFNATGWRLGYVVGPEQLMQAVVAAHTLLAYTTAGPAQRAAAKGLRLADENGFWEENRRDSERRQRRFGEVLHELGLPFTTPDAAYFVFVSTRKIRLPPSYNFPPHISARTRDVRVAYFLIQEFGVICIPGSAFYHGSNAALGDDFLRFVVCKTDEEIDVAKERLLGLKPFIADV